MDGITYANDLINKVRKVKVTGEVAPRKKEIHKTFETCLIEHLRYLIGEEVVLNCNGCRIDHPSQTQHDCVMMDTDDRTNLYLFKAVEKMDQFDVMEKWYPKLQDMELNDQELLEAYRLWRTIKKKHNLKLNESWLDYWGKRIKHHEHEESTVHS